MLSLLTMTLPPDYLIAFLAACYFMYSTSGSPWTPLLFSLPCFLPEPEVMGVEAEIESNLSVYHHLPNTKSAVLSVFKYSGYNTSEPTPRTTRLQNAKTTRPKISCFLRKLLKGFWSS